MGLVLTKSGCERCGSAVVVRLARSSLGAGRIQVRCLNGDRHLGRPSGTESAVSGPVSLYRDRQSLQQSE